MFRDVQYKYTCLSLNVFKQWLLETIGVECKDLEGRLYILLCVLTPVDL